MTNNFVMKAIKLAVLSTAALIPAMACTYSASSPVVGAGGGNVAVQVYTQPGCAWQLTSGASWMQLNSVRSGNGSGTVFVYLPPNQGAVRQAYLNVVVTYSGGGTIGGRSGVPTSAIVYRSLVTEY